MLTDFIKPKNSETFKEFSENTRSSIPTAVYGVSDSVKYLLASCLESSNVLYITRDALSARKAKEELECLTGKKCVFLPAKDDVLLYKKAFNKNSLFNRMTALYEIGKGADFVCCSFEALLQLFPERVESVTFKVASEYPLEGVINRFVNMGYKRVDFVENKGEFSVRGDIFEVYPINTESAYRCEFFGDEIEKIRLYDVYSQKPDDEVRSFTAVSASETTVKANEKERIKKQLDESVKRFGVMLARNKARQIADEIKETLDVSPSDDSLSFIAPLLPHAENGLLDFWGKDVTVVFDECKQCAENLDGLLREHAERCLSLERGGQAFDFSARQYYDREKLLSALCSRPVVALQNITTAIPLFKVLKTVRISAGAVSNYSQNYADLFNDLKNWQKSGYRVVICAGNAARAEKIQEDASVYGVRVNRTDEPGDEAMVYVTDKYLTKGFIIHDGKLAVVGTADLFIGVKEKKIRLRRKDTFSAPDVGDYAVHETHGIGIVRGTKRISTTENTKDYVALEYAGGDFLYLPVEQLDKLTKYLGGDKSPKLSKLGGVEFERLKERVRESVAQMSINLKKLYRERAENKGFVFSPDNEISREFDEAFEFDETEDQLQSIAEIKKDMESPKVMDRLLCGDVGFGKTEVALRAAFKAIMDGKQVAFVAPTTILTQQHYETCLRRFKGFGVRIALLNRFCTPQKTSAVLKSVAEGETDLVIGTHKLFSDKVKFKDLGLLILDEEQCFGVEHKEKLRVLKSNVDTLTMSATPIPRTLHMSLSGIRGISLINTPPFSRIPVQAYVVEEDDVLIRDAISRELSRNGQVFVLFNDVEGIYRYAEKLGKIVPEAKIVVGHGQMKKTQLENNVMSFYSGEYNVLVSTTIIENGIDLPAANTLIVIDADKLGLFTLYQLKGRVGRSDKMAHAYFTYKPDKVLSDTAYKRLGALMEHTDLGSGYKIAMRDLEIRGAGNVLGREQHGHMDKIGYELYSKILREQLGEVTKDFETELDVRIDAYIPESYVEVSASRLDVYKEISELRNESEAEIVLEKLRDTYGKPPVEVENLVDIAVFKNCCRELKIVKAFISQKQAYLMLTDLSALNGGISDALNEYKDCSVLSFETNPKISFEVEETTVKTLALMTDFLHFSLKN